MSAVRTLERLEPAPTPDGGPPPTHCPADLAFDEPSGVCAKEAVALIPQREDIRLWTKIFLPAEIPKGGVPTVVQRSPYLFPSQTAWRDSYGRWFAERGYAFVLQGVRGRLASEGQWEPYLHEIEDGQDLTEWIAEQPWSDAKIATMGGSYEGYTAVAAAVGNPLVKIVVADDAPVSFGWNLDGGTFRLTTPWLYLLDHGDWPPDEDVDEATNALNAYELDQVVLGKHDAFWRGSLEAYDAADHPYWGERSLAPRLADLCVPMIHVYTSQSAWTDPIKLWRDISDQACSAHRDDQRLILTSDPHAYHLASLDIDRTSVNQVMLDAIDKWAGGKPIEISSPRVQFQHNGASTLGGVSSLPVPESETLTFYLGNANGTPDAGLLDPSQRPSDSPVTLDVDPSLANPCSGNGYPVATYTSGPIDHDVQIVGDPALELWATSSTPDVDWFAQLYDVGTEPDDVITIVYESGLRGRMRGATPAALPIGDPARLVLTMPTVAHTLRAGRRLVLQLSNARCGYAENPNSGEPITAQTHRNPSHQQIHHDAVRPSRLRLPTLPE